MNLLEIENGIHRNSNLIVTGAVIEKSPAGVVIAHFGTEQEVLSNCSRVKRRDIHSERCFIEVLAHIVGAREVAFFVPEPFQHAPPR